MLNSLAKLQSSKACRLQKGSETHGCVGASAQGCEHEGVGVHVGFGEVD